MIKRINKKTIQKTIQKIFIFLLCLNLISCGGESYRAGIKFKKTDNLSKKQYGNPIFTSYSLKLDNGDSVGLYRPIGECGAGVTFFVFVLLPIPVRFYANNCNNEIIISSSSEKIQALQLKYNDKIYNAFSVEKSPETAEMFRPGGYKIYKFKIDNFKNFKNADDKVLITTTKDGFIQEFPIKWGVVRYNVWWIP